MAILLVLLLSGCVSPSKRDATQSAVWPEVNSVVSTSPSFPIGGPVESNSPTPVKPALPGSKVYPQPTETWIPLARWSRVSNEGALAQLTAAPTPTYALQSTNGRFVLHTGSQLAQWEGLEVRLGFVPQLIDGQPYVHSLDLYKTIQPLLQGDPSPALRSAPVVVIDPGHGGENSGTRSVLGNRFEKEFTMDWASRLQSVLLANNCRVFLTRSNDTDFALSNRVAFATQHKADVFISLHFNSAAPNETEAGLETYCLTPAGMPSNLTRGFPDEVHQTFPNNAFDPQNLFLAVQIHRALLQVNAHRDRGIRHARFPGVLRGQQCAAILVEGGYLSNPQEARLIEDSGYRQKLAEADARALLSRSSTGAGSVALNSATEHDSFTASGAVGEPGSGFQREIPSPSTQAPTSGGSAARVSPAQSP
ncbi:MAG TPA: N-acetylmuramoyl-L-alanine amidase [Patescibacteria group bacterium]|nr:N-acetylmuramoyl-L-alanine amidase [Patescibacteria group bacterium]